MQANLNNNLLIKTQIKRFINLWFMLDFNYFCATIPTKIICVDYTEWFRWYLLICKNLL
jgi:hypothetical protein